MELLKITSPRGWFRRAAACFVANCLVALVGIAQSQPTPPRAFTLEQAIDYALQNYPSVRAALEQVNAARAGVTLARTAYLPQLNGVYQDSRATQNQVDGIWLPTPITPAVEGPVTPSSGQSFWGSQAAALFSWEPVDFGLRPARVRQAQFTLDKAQADLALTRIQVATAVGNYFLLAVANQQAVTAAQANVDRWKTFNTSAHALVDNQLRPGADASRADAELAQARIGFYRAQQAARASRDTLAALMGMGAADFQLDAGHLMELLPAESVPNAPATENPLARDQMVAVRQSQAEERILRREDYPRFFFQAEGFGRGSEVPTSGSIAGNWNGLAPARGNWVTGITILFPNVFDFKALGAQKQIARANEQTQKARYDQTLQDLTGQIRAARDQFDSAALIAKETPTELAAAKQSEIQSRARYDANLATLPEVSEAESLLTQAELDDALARLNVWHALFGIASSQGDLQDFLQMLHAATTGAQ